MWFHYDGGRPSSQYVFLPITITVGGKMEIHYLKEWDLSLFTPQRPARPAGPRPVMPGATAPGAVAPVTVAK